MTFVKSQKLQKSVLDMTEHYLELFTTYKTSGDNHKDYYSTCMLRSPSKKDWANVGNAVCTGSY